MPDHLNVRKIEYARRYFVNHGLDANYDHNTLEGLEFRVINDNKFAFYVHYEE
ncbi:MAG: hypothetical protein ISS19_00920 [Bacteroidales bacterium]|nr:hypothetical protein [Bacteroidales bacterium]